MTEEATAEAVMVVRLVSAAARALNKIEVATIEIGERILKAMIDQKLLLSLV